MFSESSWIILLRCKIRLGFGRKKTGNLFLISCLWLPLMGGGYSVIIPRKQTCSPRLKRSLCKWACRCPALSFSVDCISHLTRLTGSFRFPCSTRIQRFAPLWIPAPDWRQSSRVCRTLNVWEECLPRLSVPLPPLRSKITKCPAGISDFFTHFFCTNIPRNGIEDSVKFFHNPITERTRKWQTENAKTSWKYI